MDQIVNYRLGGPDNTIPAETWGDGGCLELLGVEMIKIRDEYGGTGDVSAEECLSLIGRVFDRRAQVDTPTDIDT